MGRLYTALGTRRHEHGKDYEDGVLQDYMWDYLRARKHGRASSGNGRH